MMMSCDAGISSPSPTTRVASSRRHTRNNVKSFKSKVCYYATKYGLFFLLGINLMMICLHRLAKLHLKEEVYHSQYQTDTGTISFLPSSKSNTKHSMPTSKRIENRQEGNDQSHLPRQDDSKPQMTNSTAAGIPTKQDSKKQRLVDFSTLLQQRLVLGVANNMDLLPSSKTSLSTIYRDNGSWDNSPIIIEEYKLVFFTQPKIACTVFKQLLRRMMHYDEDWFVHKEPNIPHNPRKNGLKYLYEYSPSKAVEMLTSESWIRAIFVRDPLERFLSAYLDKAKRKDGMYVYRHCCGGHSTESESTCNGANVSSSIGNFYGLVSSKCCCDPHWKSQYLRLGGGKSQTDRDGAAQSLWKYMNFIGSFDSLAHDTKRLLDALDENLYGDNGNITWSLWEQYGASGWGKYRNVSIFDTSGTEAKHKTNAYDQYQMYFDSRMEKLVEEFYNDDYEHSLFNFTRKTMFSAIS